MRLQPEDIPYIFLIIFVVINLILAYKYIKAVEELAKEIKINAAHKKVTLRLINAIHLLSSFKLASETEGSNLNVDSTGPDDYTRIETDSLVESRTREN